MCPLSTSNNGIDGSVLVDFLNVKVALSIFRISAHFSGGIAHDGPPLHRLAASWANMRVSR
jgi:hypothetical protein